MKPLTREWVQKAEADHATAQREYRVRRNPNFDAVCFHAQQCVEKYLKARLQEMDRPFPKTHDLRVLLNMLLTAQPMLEALRPRLTVLNQYAVEFRYPGESATRQHARETLSHCRVTREIMRQALGLPPEASTRKRRK